MNNLDFGVPLLPYFSDSGAISPDDMSEDALSTYKIFSASAGFFADKKNSTCVKYRPS